MGFDNTIWQVLQRRGADKFFRHVLSDKEHGSYSSAALYKRISNLASNITEFVTNQIDDRLEIQLGCKPLLHAVDNGKFGGAVFGDLEQPLGLIEETRVLERDAHGIGHGLKQAYI